MGKNRIRFYGVDTWESRTRDLEEKEKGLEAKVYVKDLLENSDEGKFSIISHGRGKYGRVLGEIFVKGHEKSVNELLKENGHSMNITERRKRYLQPRRNYGYIRYTIMMSFNQSAFPLIHGELVGWTEEERLSR